MLKLFSFVLRMRMVYSKHNAAHAAWGILRYTNVYRRKYD